MELGSRQCSVDHRVSSLVQHSHHQLVVVQLDVEQVPNDYCMERVQCWRTLTPRTSDLKSFGAGLGRETQRNRLEKA